MGACKQHNARANKPFSLRVFRIGGEVMLQIYIDCGDSPDEADLKTRDRILRGLSRLEKEGYVVDVLDHFPNMEKLMAHKRIVLIDRAGTE